MMRDCHRRGLAWRYSPSVPVFALTLLLGSGPILGHAQDGTRARTGDSAAVSVLREGLALSNPGRSERTLIQADPIASRVIAGDWAMPKKGDEVTFRGGQTVRWVPSWRGPTGASPSPTGAGTWLSR